jgi:hypothetical protein
VASSRVVGLGVASTRGGALASSAPVAGPSDAGVPIYAAGSYLTNAADVTNAQLSAAKKARDILDRKDSSNEARQRAQETLKEVEKADKLRAEATDGVIKQLNRPEFVQGFGSNGGEEFLSFMNIGEALLKKGGDDWKKWDKTMTDSIVRVQDKDGSWSGQHCITGKTFCTASALLVMMTDRAPIPMAKDNVRK